MDLSARETELKRAKYDKRTKFVSHSTRNLSRIGLNRPSRARRLNRVAQRAENQNFAKPSRPNRARWLDRVGQKQQPFFFLEFFLEKIEVFTEFQYFWGVFFAFNFYILVSYSMNTLSSQFQVYF